MLSQAEIIMTNFFEKRESEKRKVLEEKRAERFMMSQFYIQDKAKLSLVSLTQLNGEESSFSYLILI